MRTFFSRVFSAFSSFWAFFACRLSDLAVNCKGFGLAFGLGSVNYFELEQGLLRDRSARLLMGSENCETHSRGCSWLIIRSYKLAVPSKSPMTDETGSVV